MNDTVTSLRSGKSHARRDSLGILCSRTNQRKHMIDMRNWLSCTCIEPPETKDEQGYRIKPAPYIPQEGNDEERDLLKVTCEVCEGTVAIADKEELIPEGLIHLAKQLDAVSVMPISIETSVYRENSE